jgi:hypothetical protein
MFTRNRNRQSLSELRDKLPKNQSGGKRQKPWLMLDPIEKYERQMEHYNKIKEHKNKVMKEMKKQRDIRKKRQEYIRSIDPNKGIKI